VTGIDDRNRWARSFQHSLPSAALVIAAAVAASAAAAPPPGATARCRDGSYSYSTHHSGTCSHHGGVAVWLDGTSNSQSSGPSSSAVVALGRTVLLAPRTRSTGCRQTAEPDRRCSPGAYSTGLTRTVLCSSSFRSSSIRNVPASEKYAVERDYGLPARAYGTTIEIDHIVPLELGGSNTIANLFPEPGSGVADYHAKDRLENRLHELVCSGSIALRAAQRGISSDWITLYRRIFGAAANG
jgi:Protein of unknown function (DUF3761)